MDLTEMTNDFVTNYDNIYYADTIQTGRALVEGPEHRYLFVDNNQGLVRNVGKNRMTKALDFVNGMRRSILAETGHECSAGISYNKFLAKLAARLNRPIETTVLVNTGGIGRVFRELTVDDVCSDNNEMIGCGDDGNGGGGQELAKRIKSELGVRRWSELLEFSSEELAAIDGQSSSTANKLWQMARGIDDRPVVGENFPTN
ncbi:DNA polymerase eta-like [Oppia nitens]|uniref:DNA polymerase eta-like n=1 Tax=Oppia nitens TaxID=1686743 RepID=UPI0023DA81DD|nr:DNA polymerase eta-like [Oppia nitens]